MTNVTRSASTFLLLLISLLLSIPGHGWVISPTVARGQMKSRRSTCRPAWVESDVVSSVTETLLSSKISSAYLSSPSSLNTLLVSEGDATWRQYVSLGVVVFVLGDILLGSPFANGILSIARPPQSNGPGEAQENNDEASGGGKASTTIERVDTSAVAQKAIDKARATMDLRTYLDNRKTDADIIREAEKKLDEEAAKLERGLSSIAERTAAIQGKKISAPEDD